VTRGRVVRGTLLVLVWLVVTVATGLLFFLDSSRTVVLASHEAELRPTLDGYVVLHTGPVLPDFRLSSGSEIGADVTLGKTEVSSIDELVERYAVIASQPEGQVAKVHEAIRSMALAAFVKGALVGLAPILLWWLLGPVRRRELARAAVSRRGFVAVVVGSVLVILVINPGETGEPGPEDQGWTSLAAFLGPVVPVPDAASGIEVSTGATSTGSHRLIESAVETFDKSKVFYADVAERAADLELHQPEPGDTVVTLVSDRHDNIGMDAVARAIGDAGGATAVFDAGDDTSTGESWEAFSLDSVNAAFSDLPRWGVAGNHDQGDFVADYLAREGWTMLDGQVVQGPGDITLLGVPDPRSSGLGSWKDEVGLSFEEVGSRLADAACESPERITTLLVHDAGLGRETLARGCADLVVGGHLHIRLGPTPVEGSNGALGYSYTTGTTGGAAYAFALGSKPRRDAMVTLLTYRDGRPIGIQPVVVKTSGELDPLRYEPLAPTDPDPALPTEPPSTDTTPTDSDSTP
jgi:hypothetical protein